MNVGAFQTPPHSFGCECGMKIIARIKNDYDGKFGVPRQSGLVEDVISAIVFEPEELRRSMIESANCILNNYYEDRK